MNFPENLKYTKDHEWARNENGIVVVGITDYAQGELGDIVFIEIPSVGTKTTVHKPFGTIEAVKAVSDLYAPVSGEIIEINQKLKDTPETVNRDPYSQGWMVKIKSSNLKELDDLMTSENYRKMIGK